MTKEFFVLRFGIPFRDGAQELGDFKSPEDAKGSSTVGFAEIGKDLVWLPEADGVFATGPLNSEQYFIERWPARP